MSKKVNHEVISLSEAEKICTKGSHRLVKWNCPDCGIEQIKTFKQALKVKRCKPCNNIVRPKPDHSGKNNPAWTGGKPHCKTCNVILGNYSSRFCPKCSEEYVLSLFGRKRLSDEQREFRKNKRYQKDKKGIAWAKLIKEKSKFTCEICHKSKPNEMISHHLNAWNAHPEQRYDLDNGVCLCETCHKAFHREYGAGNNTKAQFETFRASFQPFPASSLGPYKSE